jgi:hypothetical protein
MKLQVVGVLGIMVTAALSVGCNGSSQAKAKTPTDVFSAMNAELENAISTTSVTSDEIPLPESRLPVAQWEDDEAPAKPLQTWGAAPESPPAETLASGPGPFDRL